MATYKISYMIGDSFSNKGERYIDNVIDEYEAVESMIVKYNLPENIKINKIELVCE